jgi:hypothetical protein
MREITSVEEAEALVADGTTEMVACTYTPPNEEGVPTPCRYKAPAFKIGTIDTRLTPNGVGKPICRTCYEGHVKPRGIPMFNFANTIRQWIRWHREDVERADSNARRRTAEKEAFAAWTADLKPVQPRVTREEDHRGHRIGDDPQAHEALERARHDAEGEPEVRKPRGRAWRRDRDDAKKERHGAVEPAE